MNAAVPKALSALMAMVGAGLLMPCNVTGQPSVKIDSTSVPAVGTQIQRYQLALPTVAPADTGRGQTWRFAAADTQGLRSIRWLSGASNLPAANRSAAFDGLWFQAPGSQPLGPWSTLGEGQWRGDSAGLQWLGYDLAQQQTITLSFPPAPPVQLTIPPQQVASKPAAFDVLRFPLHYGDSSGQTVTYELSGVLNYLGQQDSFRLKRRLQRTQKADASGRLLTPADTFPRSLRVRNVLTQRDSLLIQQPNGSYQYQPSQGSYVNTSQQTQYLWYSNRQWRPFALFRNGAGQALGGYFTGRPQTLLRFEAGQDTVLDEATGTHFVRLAVQYPPPSSSVRFQLRGIAQSAGLPQDVTLPSQQIEVQPGDDTLLVPIQLQDDALLEHPERFALKLTEQEPQAATLQPDSLRFRIRDNDHPRASFARADTLLLETQGNAVLGLQLAPTYSQGPLKFRVRSRDSTAQAGLDYAPLDTVLRFAAGANFKQIPLRILDDQVSQNTHYLKLALTPVSPIARVAFPNELLVGIRDDDYRPAVGFRTADTSVFEAVGTLRMPLVAEIRATEPIDVRVQSQPLSAQPGRDYLALDSTLQFQPGDSVLRVPLRVINDTLPEPTRQLALQISSLSPNAQLGIDSAVVRLTDNDPSHRPGRGEASSVQVLPNPAANRLSLRGLAQRPQAVTMLSPEGRRWHLKVRPNGTSYQLNLAPLPAGVFLLRVKTAGGILNRRVVVTP